MNMKLGTTANTTDHLEALIPIAVVIAAGCEPCARSMTERALTAGTPRRAIRRVLKMVDHMHRQECLAQNAGAEAMARMARPLETAATTLQNTNEKEVTDEQG